MPQIKHTFGEVAKTIGKPCSFNCVECNRIEDLDCDEKTGFRDKLAILLAQNDIDCWVKENNGKLYICGLLTSVPYAIIAAEVLEDFGRNITLIAFFPCYKLFIEEFQIKIKSLLGSNPALLGHELNCLKESGVFENLNELILKFKNKLWCVTSTDLRIGPIINEVLERDVKSYLGGKGLRPAQNPYHEQVMNIMFSKGPEKCVPITEQFLPKINPRKCISLEDWGPKLSFSYVMMVWPRIFGIT